MDQPQLDSLIHSWFLATGAGDEGTGDENWWAYMQVSDYLKSNQTEAWQFIQSAYKHATTHHQQLVFGCGPLEEFIHNHAAAYIDEIENLGKADPAFADLLGTVWYSDTVPPDIWSRIETLRGEPWGP